MRRARWCRPDLRTSPRPSSPPTCASPPRPWRWPRAGCWSRMPATARSSSSPPTAPCCAGGAASASPTDCACCPPRSRPPSATTSSSRTRSDTGCTASRCRTRRAGCWSATAGSGSRATGASGCRARGTSPGGRTGSGSRWPACTSSGRSTRSPASARSRPAPPTRVCSTLRSPRRGWPRPPASLPTATDSGSPTPRPRRCAGSRPARCTPRSAPACSSSGSATARAPRRCSSTPSGSACCPTGASPSATPTTVRSVATTRSPPS
ncbi:unannotated protein [freshwater metagenome]|uniref:Unannotated protein n=1 Tax=freshwater metagenome TaxID=449393 RepID=A0A6J6RL96_9ZZZZ